MQQFQLRGLAPYRFRWVFDYADSTPTKRGIWDTHIRHDPAGNYILNSTNNLLFAAIEAQDRDKMHIMRFAECRGQDFCRFEYIARSRLAGKLKTNTTQLESVIVGLRLVSRHGEIAAWRDGRVESRDKKYPDTMFEYGRIR